MRIGVLDVGSNSAHLKVVDLDPGDAPRTVATVKHPTRLAESIDRDGVLRPEAIGRLLRAVASSVRAATAHDVDELIAFATSAVRDAANRDQIVARVAAATGLHLGSLSGPDEARLVFAAARAWYGWSAGPLLVADIGGGSLEIAHGDGDTPEVALSLPLGAGRLTREHLPGDPPSRKHVRRLRRHVREQLLEATADLHPANALAVGTSRTFTQLARLTGAPRRNAGPYVKRELKRKRLRAQIPVLAAASTAERAALPGVSRPRARQILAGAITAEATMTVLDLPRIRICPWAVREGIVLHRLQALRGAPGTDLAPLTWTNPRARPLRAVPAL
ncbi:Ppx/GppA family phosphatase [Spirillospora sp. NPDC052242]